MSALTLRLKKEPGQRVDMGPLTPDRLTGMGGGEIERIPLWCGKHRIPVGDLFTLEGSGSEQIYIHSDSDRLDRIGAAMSRGEIRVEGCAGAYLGQQMRGGSLQVSGDTGAFAGNGLAAGSIRIDGDAGDFLGGSISGERQGMRGGRIWVRGSAGDRVGDQQRRGLILIEGDSGDYTASRMNAGTILVLGQTGGESGFSMRRGTLLLARKPAALPVTFGDNGEHNLGILSLLLRDLQQQTGIPLTSHGNRVQRWVGDLGCAGMGEILIWR